MPIVNLAEPIAQSPEIVFRKRLSEMGATLLEDKWLGYTVKHRVRCANGHISSPQPSNVNKGQGICRLCNPGYDRKTNQRSINTELRFRQLLEEKGATLLELEWLGSNKPHHVLCPKGHSCYPRPDSIFAGQGVCRTCKYENHMAGNKLAIASEDKFRARLEELGATLQEDKYLGSQVLHRVTCVNGHACCVRPALVNYGRGICRTCVGLDPIQAEQKFLSRLEELGATPLYDQWMGANAPHAIRCVNGHESSPRPSGITSRARQGICKICAGNDAGVAEQNFRARVAELGGTCHFTTWRGSNNAHHVRCAMGHDCYPRPGHVSMGHGICRICTQGADDIFYIVRCPDDGSVKFGITQKDPRPRLATHRRDGYSEVIRIVGELPEGDPRDIERNIIHALRDASIKPIQGREYYPAEAFALIMDVADGFLSQYEITGERVF